MRTKITLLLVFLNVVLFFVIFYFERVRTPEPGSVDGGRVLGPEAANLSTLALSGRTLDTPVELTRTGDAWAITAPYEWPANPHAVSRIVTELQFLEHDTSFSVANLGTTGLSLADYGLDDPALTVTLTTGTGDATGTTALALGNRTEIGQRLYVLSPDGSRVHVVPDTLAQSLSLDLGQLRANSCFTIPVFEVRSLNLQNDGPANVRVRLRREGNRWRFESPVDARASKTATEVVLNDIASLRTADFLGAPSTAPDLMAVAGLDTPFLRITLEGNNRRETLLLGNEIDATANSDDETATPSLANREFYAQMEGRDALFTVVLPQRLANDLRNAQSALRDKTVLDLAGREIDAITLADEDGREVVLQKVEASPSDGATGAISSWQVVQRDADDGSLSTQPADATVVEEQLLSALRSLRATSFERDVPTDTELETWGLTRPSRTITLSFAPGLGASTPPPDVTLLLGTDQAGTRVFAQVTPETFVYGVDPAILDETPTTALHYRERLLQELPAGARITGLSLRDLTDNNELYAHQLAADETWDEADATAAPDRQAALRRLRAELRTLEAAELVNDSFTEQVIVTGQTRPWRYQLDVSLSVSGDEGEQAQGFTLYLAERDGGDRQLVGSPDLELVFAATPELVSALWNLTYTARDPGPTERTPPPAEPATDVAPEPTN